jgi:23S rRNA (uridine2552-2'-O)-methyltransferase
MADRRDSYYWKAKEDKFSSRAAFKLIEILNKFYLSAEGKNVLEIGSNPGGWSEVISMNNPNFHVAVDIKKENVETPYTFIRGDISRDSTWENIGVAMNENGVHEFDLIISDAMVNTSGNTDVDHSSSFLICSKIMEMGMPFLSRGGTVILKQFQGDLTQSFMAKWSGYFRKATITKPVSSRQASREIYIVFKSLK